MNDPALSPQPPAPVVTTARVWNLVWVVPLLAVLLGGWMLIRNFATQGPVAQVTFDTAEEIYAGRTEVRCRSVKVGMVTDVGLADDLNSVVVRIELEEDAAHLLRRGTRFWVVKPRVTGAGISGLTTLIQGAYVELDPGNPDAPRESEFTGLETPPATSLSVPGRRVVLVTDEAGLLVEGSPIYFRGFEVGRIEARSLSADGVSVSYNGFIRKEHAGLVNSHTRFWNTSGIDISAGAEGFKVRTPSLQSMLSGGVAFGTAAGAHGGELVADGTMFRLYRDEDEAMGSSFDPTLKLLLLFNQSVRGLAKRSPVEFRGIPIGRVTDISLALAPSPGDPRIPVLVEIDPSLISADAAAGTDPSQDISFLRKAVASGLRASLKTGSLITGALYVDFDYLDDAVPAELGSVGGYHSVPTVYSGFAQLEARLSALFDKLESVQFTKAVDEIAAAAASARAMLDDPALRELPANLRRSIEALESSVSSLGPDGAVQGDLLRTLDELRATLRSLKSVATTIEEQPNSLIFGRDPAGSPEPKATPADR
ncbi:MAG: MCE family protein [Verrucomicrobia bacterium]|nr:MCE family protein [Verrucomicrobiota bacterium]